MQNYITIKRKSNAELVEKKSRFIANIFNIKSEEEANEKINEIKKIHRDARHNVYAYRLENGIEKYSDDGEPSGTAGVPILDILRGEKLVNVLVVVTRYFGGILLRNRRTCALLWWSYKVSFARNRKSKNEFM